MGVDSIFGKITEVDRVEHKEFLKKEREIKVKMKMDLMKQIRKDKNISTKAALERAYKIIKERGY